MRTIIAGSRDVTDYQIVVKAILAANILISCVVSGTARGVDRLGEDFARAAGIPVALYPAEWTKYGKSAGYRRNEVMAANADALIAIWDGKSVGTKHMIDIAKKFKLKVYVHRTDI